MRLWTLWRERDLSLQNRILVEGGIVKVGNPKKSNAVIQIPVRHPLFRCGEIPSASIVSADGKLMLTAERYGDDDRACVLISGQPGHSMTPGSGQYIIQDPPPGVTIIAKCTMKFDNHDDEYDEALIIMEPDAMLPIRSGPVEGILHCVRVPGVPTELFLWRNADVAFFDATFGGNIRSM